MTETLHTFTGPIAYDRRGTPREGAPPFVLLASGAHDRHDWDELRERLADLETIAIDWPAHGDSPASSGSSTVLTFAAIAEQAVEQLAPNGAILVGNSIGGFSAARLAIRRPELVRGLVIVDGGGFLGRSPLIRAFCALMSRPRFLRAIYPAFSSRYMRARTAADRRAQQTGVRTTRGGDGLRTIAELWGSFASPEHDLRSRAREISAPTLLLWGKRDPVIPLRAGRRAHRLIPGSQLLVLDTGHVPHTTEPERVAEALRELLSTVLGEAAEDQPHAREAA